MLIEVYADVVCLRCYVGEKRLEKALRDRPDLEVERFDFDRVTSAPNTVDAHRLVLHAAERGKQREASEALFCGYFAEDRDLTTPTTSW